MNRLNAPRRQPAVSRTAGFTLVEMMVAMAIAMIVLLGLSVTFVNLKSTFNSQDKFAQLQDNERLALSMLTTSLNEAGYWPNPWSMDRAKALTLSSDPTYGTMQPGWAVFGQAAVAGPPVVTENLQTAYVSASGDGVLTCQGGTNTSGSNGKIRNVFYVQTDPSTGISSLGCAVLFNDSTTTSPGAAWTPIINNVQSMSVMYGVDSDGDNLVDKYLGPADVTTQSLWGNVKSAQITLNFTNPYSPGSTIPWVYTVNLMNNR